MQFKLFIHAYSSTRLKVGSLLSEGAYKYSANPALILTKSKKQAFLREEGAELVEAERACEHNKFSTYFIKSTKLTIAYSYAKQTTKNTTLTF